MIHLRPFYGCFVSSFPWCICALFPACLVVLVFLAFLPVASYPSTHHSPCSWDACCDSNRWCSHPTILWNCYHPYASADWWRWTLGNILKWKLLFSWVIHMVKNGTSCCYLNALWIPSADPFVKSTIVSSRPCDTALPKVHYLYHLLLPKAGFLKASPMSSSAPFPRDTDLFLKPSLLLCTYDRSSLFVWPDPAITLSLNLYWCEFDHVQIDFSWAWVPSWCSLDFIGSCGRRGLLIFIIGVGWARWSWVRLLLWICCRFLGEEGGTCVG